MKAALIAGLLALAGPALAGPPQWTWEAGKQTHDGAITLKSTNGSATYSGTQNPTGAVAKINQTAVTQPPTVIIQATSGSGSQFSYKDDCWIFDLAGHVNQWFIGAGKMDETNKKFTGIMGWAMGSGGYYSGGGQVMAALSGSGFSANSSYGSGNPYWCGSDASCAWSFAGVYGGGSSGTPLVGVAALPVLTYQKCYP